jgi:hypothetical protein
VAIAVVAAVLLTDRDDGTSSEPSEPASVAVSSDAPRVDTLQELVAASDWVVRGEVVRVGRGRVFGEPGGAVIQSRVLMLRVDEVLTGPATEAGTRLVEEEGWLADGTPLVVDGVDPSAVGDDGIWFLVDVEEPDGPRSVVVSAQGRYLVDGPGLRGADLDDPLVRQLSALTVQELAERVAASSG